jgi:hypothetical protein
MRPAVVFVVVAACGAPPPRVTTVVPTGHHDAMTFRRLEVGKVRGHAVRTTFVLDLDHATIDETDETLAKSVTVAEADGETAWETKARHRYVGARRDAKDGVQLDLEAPDSQPLHLMCTSKRIEAAAAHAVRVASPDRGDDYECGDKGVWSPAGTSTVETLACIPAGTSVDTDDDDELVFAPGPGLEWVFQNDDCVIQGGGFRRR